jgi:hypothetical protein
MEDDDEEVVQLVNATIRSIEELAGEKLDAYLQ